MFKATAIFGGVQFFQVIITIIKSKLVAVLVGSTGMGIMGLFTTTTGLINSITSFGLGTSAVKSIANANASGETDRIRIVSSTLKKLVWITGLLGVLLTASLSPFLSKIAFGNYGFTLSFLILAPTLLLTQLSVAQLALMQGLRKIAFLSKANFWSALCGLIIAIPLYYIFNLKGIVLVLLCTAIASFIITTYYSKKIKVENYKLSNIKIWEEGKDMLKLGLVINLSSILTLFVGYLIRLYISNQGGIQQVGYYTAGFTILNTYVGMITNAIVADYYPRLSEAVSDNSKLSRIVNQQTEMLLLLLTPILCLMIIFLSVILKILYTNEFLNAEIMMIWAAFGILFRTVSWTISYIFMAKSDIKLFITVEFSSYFYFLPLQIIGYELYGLKGIGIAFLVSYIIYLIIVFLVSTKKYGYKFNHSLKQILFINIFLVLICFLMGLLLRKPYVHLFGMLPILCSFIYSFMKLDKMISFSHYLSRFKKRQL